MAGWLTPRHQQEVLDALGITSVDPMAQSVPEWFALYDTLPIEQATQLVIIRACTVLRGELRVKAASVTTEAQLTALRAERETLSGIANDAQNELNRIYKGRAPVADVLTTTAPQSPPLGWPNANAARYRGSPYLPGTEDW